MANGKKRKKLTQDPPDSFADPLFAGPAHELLRRRVLGGRTPAPDAGSSGHLLGGYGAARPVERTVGSFDRDDAMPASRSGDEQTEIRPAPSGGSLVEEEFHWHGLRHASVAPEDRAASAPGGEPAAIPVTARDRLLRLWSVASETDLLAATAHVPGASEEDAPAEAPGLDLGPEEPTPRPTSAPAASGVEELELIRAVATGVEHMVRSIDELRVAIDTLGNWAATLAPELGERSLGRLVRDAELLVERGIEATE